MIKEVKRGKIVSDVSTKSPCQKSYNKLIGVEESRNWLKILI